MFKFYIIRSKRKSKDPHTPDPKQTCSKRSWDGQIRKWRRLLHDYDPPLEEGAEEAEDFSILETNGKCENQEDSAQSLKVTSDISTRYCSFYCIVHNVTIFLFVLFKH